MNELAPIVLFLYNRPDHCKRTLDALALNPEAISSQLFIYCDGPKKGAVQSQLEAIEKVRILARGETRFGSVKVIEQMGNKGLAASIVDGVTEILDKYGKIIVLEDDLVTSPLFLKFMNNALNKYKDEEKVACISGYVYPLENDLEDTLFIKGADCWGWATWADQWKIFRNDPVSVKADIIKSGRRKEFDFNNTYPYLKMLEERIEGKNQSWAILWYASAFLLNRLCLYPSKSLVHNIGNDGSGTHTGEGTEKFDAKMNVGTLPEFPERIEESRVGRKRFESFFKSLELMGKKGIRSALYRIKNGIKRRLYRKEFYLKRRNGDA